ncbi:MAG: FAD-dependent thymidylate synthase [Cyanobacteria bacterium CRU_2_1]|nr:FAD-dependent thymidylate synthase [Cyanobacteria bacterium RU_5_0]NJR61820.1 FAD-dependent thymidylate synthase [Cyanobacteria bacterium CRU_2_1]
MDRFFTVEVLSHTANPQQVIYAAMHQDYAESFVWSERDRFPSETQAGEIIIKHLLAGNRGHYGPLEHPQITLNCGFFPHSTMQQMRTHRVGVSFDVQCLAGDMEVTFLRASGSLWKIKISELCDLWMNGEQAICDRQNRGRNGEPPEHYRRDCKTRLKKLKLRVLNEETGIFEMGHIREVFDQGIQPVYRLTLEDGRTLDCTDKHRLLTSEGWQTMKESMSLIIDSHREVVSHKQDCYLMTNGVIVAERLYQDKNWLQEPLLAGLTSRQIASKPTGHKVKAHLMRVVQVKYLGLQRTYDLEVDGAWHNFVANGVVVHNSLRYTGKRIIDVVEGIRNVEEVFYLRPVGTYSDRQGKHYEYTEEQRQQDLDWCLMACKRYHDRIHQGFAEEHARGLIPFDVRQHWVLSANVRSLMHLLDLRWKLDAQLEIQELCSLMWKHFEAWVPHIAEWYSKNRAHKAKLAP